MKNKILITDNLKILFLVSVVMGGLMLSTIVLAHPGGLNAAGCHTCRKNCAQYDLRDGEYHCHNNSSKSIELQTSSTLEMKGIVSSVVDGDTIYVIINKKRNKVRLIGIDAPEMKDQSKIKKCLAKEAKKYLEKLLKGKSVILKSDPQSQDKDKYKRILRYVYLENIFVNAELIKNGYAYAFTEYPFQYIEEFETYEDQAKERGLNIWGDGPCKKIRK